jgi:hypothetical protein
MKKHVLLLKRFLLLAMIIMLTSIQGFAVSHVVSPGFQTLTDAVKMYPGDTLILQRGEIYVIDASVVIDFPTVIIGEDTPVEKAPAVIQMYANPGTAAGLFEIFLKANATFKNLGFIGYTTSGEIIKGIFATLVGKINLTIDHCVFQSYRWSIFPGGKKNLQITLKNNTFFNNSVNMWDNSAGFGGLVVGGDSLTLNIYNNTYFTGGRIFGSHSSGPSGSQFIEHNTYVNTWGDTFFPVTDKNFVLKNNIFYNSNLRGYVGLRISGSDTIWAGDYSDWIDGGDTLCGDFAIKPHVLDSVGGPRQVEVTHNLKMYEQRVLDWYALHGVSTQTFFNVTGKIYAEKYDWMIQDNILQEEGNTVDPQFDSQIPDAAFEMMYKQRIERSLPPASQGVGFPYDLGWRPNNEPKQRFIWPIPVNLKPTNEQLWKAGDDGYPLGDLNWFGPNVIAAWENDEQNPINLATSMYVTGLEATNITTADNLNFSVFAIDDDQNKGFYADGSNVNVTATITPAENVSISSWQMELVDGTDISSDFKVSLPGDYTLTVSDDNNVLTDVIKTFTVTFPSSAFSRRTDGFRIYPNPAKDVVTISNCNIADFEMLNLLGQSVLVDKSRSNIINISRLNSGTYFVKVTTTEGDVIFEKLMKN